MADYAVRLVSLEKFPQINAKVLNVTGKEKMQLTEQGSEEEKVVWGVWKQRAEPSLAKAPLTVSFQLKCLDAEAKAQQEAERGTYLTATSSHYSEPFAFAFSLLLPKA